ncbi:4-amino-4-deoxy-L-arabinose transferase-like glycosyltransferase [Actinopolyspora lacussalsi]|nr:4-amino-4-deoxy-L-arabinose transferase-like glycosyltransferase [Actinopolyspora lacussalsi]
MDTLLAGRQSSPSPNEPTRRSHPWRALRGRSSDPAWVRPALLLLLAVAALLYAWGLGSSDWANGFYSAAVQAGTQSWQAWLFGSSDAANAITVDKPPAALWPMVLSARIFGLSSWSILLPQALAGVLTVGLLYATVRRCAGPTAGLLAGAVQLLTPVAVLMFRFNNPDALLVLLLVAAAYCVVRATERASPLWLSLAGVAIGFGFLTKMLQAFVVLPVFAAVYLLAAPIAWWKRLSHLAVAGLSVLVSAGWYIALVEFWPSSNRPYIGGSQHDSLWELTVGYNGLGRLTGEEAGGLGNTNSDMGWNRLLGAEMGDQIGWLLPAALILLAAGLWMTRRAPRTDPTRVNLLLWGGWLVLTGVIFSYANGIIHSYYAVALSPAVAALVGIGGTMLWHNREDPRTRLTLAGTVLITVTVGALLLRESTERHQWLVPAVVFLGTAAACLLLVVSRTSRALALSAVAAALVACLTLPTVCSVATAATPHTGVLPAAGFGGSDGFGGDGGGGGGGGDPGRGGGTPFGNGGFAGGGGGGGGGAFGISTPDDQLRELLLEDAESYSWVAATTGSSNAAGYQLATRQPVMAIGGFNGTDPYPTLGRFRELVEAGRIHYYIDASILGGMGGMTTGADNSATGTADRISQWVERNYEARTVNGTTVYDLGD